MSKFSTQFNLAIQTKFKLMMSLIFIKHGVASSEDELLVSDANLQAYQMGYGSNFSTEIADYFEGTTLKDQYLSGHSDFEDHLDNLSPCGSVDEFNALSEEDRSKEWDEFHSRCVEGTADEMYFFDVMMKQWQVNHEGH
jgi:hypothetical protein